MERLSVTIDESKPSFSLVDPNDLAAASGAANRVFADFVDLNPAVSVNVVINSLVINDHILPAAVVKITYRRTQPADLADEESDIAPISVETSITFCCYAYWVKPVNFMPQQFVEVRTGGRQAYCCAGWTAAFYHAIALAGTFDPVRALAVI
jgi:hypothetical protein